jgi:hypothetical protein
MRKNTSKKNDMKSLLKNKNILYIVLFFSTLNLFSYLMLKQLDAVAFFIIIGFLASYFSKNMIVIMLTSMISTFILVQINMLGKVQEGMEGKDESAEKKTLVETENQVLGETPTEKTPEKKAAVSSSTMMTPPDAKPAESLNGTQRAALSKPEKFTQKLSPARYNASDDDDEPRHKPKIDYASTLESAYDNLDKLLGSDAIRNMTEDTGRLAEKQQLLMGNIEKITPIMEKAGSILNSFDMGAITKLMDKFGGNKNIKPIPETE